MPLLPTISFSRKTEAGTSRAISTTTEKTACLPNCRIRG